VAEVFEESDAGWGLDDATPTAAGTVKHGQTKLRQERLLRSLVLRSLNPVGKDAASVA
jgi:hypothetical protein